MGKYKMQDQTEQLIDLRIKELYIDTKKYADIDFVDFITICDTNDLDTLDNTIEILKDTGNYDGIYELFEGLLDEL